MNNKTILITGSTDGIGKQTALELAGLGATVIVHGRNELKAKAAAEELISKSENSNIDFFFADLSSLNDIRQMSGAIHEKYKQIDIMINNAGVYKNNRELSVDGFELTFAVNHLAYFLLTGLLLNLLKKSNSGRIINVASQAHASFLDFENLQAEKSFDGYDAYSRSKLCNILFTYQIARKLTDSTITVNALHPGVINTKLLHNGWGSGGSAIGEGSETSVYLASSPDVKQISGQYFSNLKSTRSSLISYDLEIQNRLWDISESMTGLMY